MTELEKDLEQTELLIKVAKKGLGQLYSRKPNKKRNLGIKKIKKLIKGLEIIKEEILNKMKEGDENVREEGNVQ